jgi:hypothetical protein
VIANSTTTGNVTMTNNNSGQTFTKSLSSPNAPLCLEFADWVVEQGAENMAAFPPITITPTATLVSGVTALPSLGHGAVYPHNIVIDSTTYVTGYVAAPTAVVVADEAFYAP